MCAAIGPIPIRADQIRPCGSVHPRPLSKLIRSTPPAPAAFSPFCLLAPRSTLDAQAVEPRGEPARFGRTCDMTTAQKTTSAHACNFRDGRCSHTNNWRTGPRCHVAAEKAMHMKRDKNKCNLYSVLKHRTTTHPHRPRLPWTPVDNHVIPPSRRSCSGTPSPQPPDFSRPMSPNCAWGRPAPMSLTLLVRAPAPTLQRARTSCRQGGHTGTRPPCAASPESLATAG